MTRRQWCTGLAAVAGSLLASACASVSPQEEQRLGRKEADEVERTAGLVDDPKVVPYVQAIGTRLAQAAGRPDIPWAFQVTDEPEANAFALPGGFVYVTRGLLALANREDELAGVMGHEMGHVTERHAVRRVGVATPLAVLFGVPSGLLGAVSPTLGGIVGGAGRLVTGLTLAPYSREQERDADRIGVALAARAGWDPNALAAFLTTLERADALGGGAKGSPFFATHPSTPERIANVQALARTAPRADVAPIAGSRAAFLQRVEGIVVGDNAANGVFAGSLFLHRDLDVALEMPSGWTTANSSAAAAAMAPQETAVVVLQVVATGDDPLSGARSDGLGDAQIQRMRRFDIGRLPAASLDAGTRDGDRVALTWIAHNQRVFRITGATNARDWERYRSVFGETASTFRPLRPDDQPWIVESRLRIRAARAGETPAQVLARGGGTWSAALAAIANGVSPDARLDAGWPVKVAVSEPYRGAPAPR